MHTLTFVLWLMSGSALAGDPCPITFDVYEVTPQWRDRDADLAALARKNGIMGFVYQDLRITSVVPGEPADVAGLRVGDVIQQVNGTPVRDHNHADELIRSERKTIGLTVGRNEDAVTLSIEKEPTDPLLMHMLQMVKVVESTAEEQSLCLQMRRGALTPDQDRRIHAAAFNPSRGFQCADAHTRLPTSAFEGHQPLILIRGGSRILLTVPDWGTTCVAVSDYDGDQLTHQRVLALVQDVGKQYIKDRHDNP